MKKSIAKLIIALLVIVTSVVVVLGGMNISVFDYDIKYPNALDEDWGIRQGLDLVGGSVITYEAQTETATPVFLDLQPANSGTCQPHNFVSQFLIVTLILFPCISC